MPEGFIIKYSNGMVGGPGSHPMYPAFSKEAALKSIPHLAAEMHLTPEEFFPVSLGEVHNVTERVLGEKFVEEL